MHDFESLKTRLRRFADERDWNQYHSPKNLAMALSVEVAELVECFQWLTEAQSQSLDSDQRQAVIDEIADVQLYLVRLADKLDVDIVQAVEQKIIKNEAKYPADQVNGSAQKYTAYQSTDQAVTGDG